MALVFDNTYARLPELFFSRTPPHAPRAPELVVFNWPLARRLGLEAADEATLARWFSGAGAPPGAFRKPEASPTSTPDSIAPKSISSSPMHTTVIRHSPCPE